MDIKDKQEEIWCHQIWKGPHQNKRNCWENDNDIMTWECHPQCDNDIMTWVCHPQCPQRLSQQQISRCMSSCSKQMHSCFMHILAHLIYRYPLAVQSHSMHIIAYLIYRYPLAVQSHSKAHLIYRYTLTVQSHNMLTQWSKYDNRIRDCVVWRIPHVIYLVLGGNSQGAPLSFE